MQLWQRKPHEWRLAVSEARARGEFRAVSRALENRIAAVAARQHGVVTHHQLVEAGLSPFAIGRRLRSGRLRRLHRGVYLATPLALEHTAEMAAVLATPGGVVSHVSGGTLWSIPRLTAANVVDVTVAGNRGRHPGIRVHRVVRLADDERAVVQGIPLTTPARTLLDLASLLPAHDLEAAVAWAQREGLVTTEALRALLARHVGQRGAPALRAVLRLSGEPALTRSTAEQQFLALVREAGLPTPQCNISVGRFEVDFLWRAAGIAVEVDGFRYHGSRPRFEEDRHRDTQLAAAGINVVRLTWRQITEERVPTVVQLAQALAHAAHRKS